MLMKAENKENKMIRDERLKPCPFCGGYAVIGELGNGTYVPYCRKCNTEYGKDFKTVNGAVRAWNRRADTIGLWDIRKSEHDRISRLENTLDSIDIRSKHE